MKPPVRGARSNITRKIDWESFRVLKRGFEQNSDSDMRTFRSCDVKIFETQTGTVRRLSHKARQRKPGTILDGESRRRESKGTYECCAA